jgi:hypothetical protein
VQPFTSQIIKQRDIDILFDVLLNIGESKSNILLPVALAVSAVLMWIFIQIVSIWLEGGTFTSYISGNPISWQDFLRANNKWFGFTLLLSGLGTLITTGILGMTAFIGLVLRGLWSPLMWSVFIIGLVLINFLKLWLETACAVAVSRTETRIGYVLLRSFKLIKQKPGQFLGLYTLSLSAILFLRVVQRWLIVVIPFDWWLLSFLVFQIMLIMRYGLRLFRKSGEIILAHS